MNDKNNTTTKYVRIRRTVRERFVEFDFAINDPELFVELILPIEAFETFCRDNNVVELTEAQAESVDEELTKWRYGEDTLVASNKNRNCSHAG